MIIRKTWTFLIWNAPGTYSITTLQGRQARTDTGEDEFEGGDDTSTAVGHGSRAAKRLLQDHLSWIDDAGINTMDDGSSSHNTTLWIRSVLVVRYGGRTTIPHGSRQRVVSSVSSTGGRCFTYGRRMKRKEESERPGQ